jgi:hypothetical protein
MGASRLFGSTVATEGTCTYIAKVPEIMDGKCVKNADGTAIDTTLSHTPTGTFTVA